MIVINESNFEQEVKMSQGITIVDFFTPWCGPCRTLSPILEKITGAKVLKVDGDQSQNLVVENSVRGYPTLVFFKNGVEKQRVVGVRSQKEIQHIVDSLGD